MAFVGKRPGKTLYIQAAQHAEYQGSGAIKNLIEGLDPEKMCGSVILVPITDTILARKWRAVKDPENPFTRDNMHEYWPGRKHGTLKERAVSVLFQDWMKYANAFVDLHSWYGASVPSVLVDESDDRSVKLAQKSGYPVVSLTPNIGSQRLLGGTYQRVPKEGIPGFCMEANHDWKFGGYLRKEMMDLMERSLRNVMKVLGILPGKCDYPKERYVVDMQEELPEANFAGLLVPEVRLGTLVERGARVAGIYEPGTFRLIQEISTRKGGLYFGTFPGSMVKKGDWAALIKTHVRVLAS